MSSVGEDVEGELRPLSDEMDEWRQPRMAYLYLCHLEETRLWLSSCIEEELPSATQLEESLRNGVYLARLSHFFAPDQVPLRNIYDADQSVHRKLGLCFRHTDNINHWLKAMSSIGFLEYFFQDPFDLYEKKNLPKDIYCLHALSLYLLKLGVAPRIKQLTGGKLHFSDDEVEQAAVLTVSERLERSRLNFAMSPLLTRLQAHARGFLVRRAVCDQYAYYEQHLNKIVRIHSWLRTVRTMRQLRRYLRMLYDLHVLVPFLIRLQSYVRGYLARKAVKDRRREYYSSGTSA